MTENFICVNKIIVTLILTCVTVLSFGQQRWYVAENWKDVGLPLDLSITRNLSVLSIAGWGIETDADGVSGWNNYGTSTSRFVQNTNSQKPKLDGQSGELIFDGDHFRGFNSVMSSDSAYTVIFYTKNPNQTGQERLLMTFSGADDNQFILMADDNGTSKRYQNYFGTNSGNITVSTGYDFDRSTYHTVAYTFKEQGPVEIYVDDVREAQNLTGYTWYNGGATYSAQLGEGVTDVNPMEGNLGFVAIYNTLLDSTEIVTVSQELRDFLNNKDDYNLTSADDFILSYYGNNAVFDETNEKVVNLQDVSGTNAATQINSLRRPTYNFGKKAYQFSRADSNFISFNNPFTAASVPDSSYTIHVTFKANILDANTRKILELSDGINSDLGFYHPIFTENDSLKVGIRTDNSAFENWSVATPIEANRVYSVTCVVSEGGTSYVYLDGELVGTIVGDGSFFGGAFPENYLLGAKRDTADQFFDGDIYFFGITDTKMSQNDIKLLGHEIKTAVGLPSDFTVNLSDLVDLTSNPLVAYWDFDDIVRTPNTNVSNWYDRLDNIHALNPYSNNLRPWYTEENVGGRIYPALTMNEELGNGTVDYGRTLNSAYFLGKNFSVVTILKRNVYKYYHVFFSPYTSNSSLQYGWREENASQFKLLVENSSYNTLNLGVGDIKYFAWNYTPTGSDLYTAPASDPLTVTTNTSTYAENDLNWANYRFNWAARYSGGNTPSQMSFIDKVLFFENPITEQEASDIFKFWPYLNVPNHLINNYTDQEVVYEFLPETSLVNDTVSVDEYYEPISGKTFIDAGSVSRFTLNTWNSAPNYFVEGGLYSNNTTEIDPDTVITVISRVSGSTLGGQVFGNFVLDERMGLRHQSYRFYGVQPSFDLDALEIYTNEVNDRTHISLMNPTTGNKYLWEDQSSFDPHIDGSYITTPQQRFDSFCLGCTGTNRDEWKGRIYGAYVLNGNVTLQEAKDLINNWDYYHDRRVNRSSTYSISKNIDNNLIAGWAMDTNYMAIDSMVSTGRYHIDSIECILGDKAGDSNFDLIETGTGSVFDINLVQGSKGYLNLDGTSIKTRDTASMGNNLSYIVFWQQPFTTSASTLVSEFTATGNTTGFYGNVHTGNAMGVYNNNNNFTSIASPYPESDYYFGELGWAGNTSRWDIEVKDDDDFWKEDFWGDDYSYTSYASGSNDHGTGLSNFDQPVFNGRDGGLFDVGNVNFHKYILIFSGSLSQEEKDDLYRAIISGKKLEE